MYSYTEENYLKAIYKLAERSEDTISTNAIAEVIQTKAASVTDMIKKLSDKKLLIYEKYKGVTLTSKGSKVAIDVVRKHRLWECFLYEKLNFGWDEVHEVAEQLEHIHSDLLTDKLDEFLGFPAHDPHGDPIPSKNGTIKKSNFIILSDAPVGEWHIMSGVVDHTNVFLQHLNKVGIALGTLLKIAEKNDYDGALTVELEGKKVLYLSKDVSKNILTKRAK